jgi:hypothetical protein
MPRARSKKRIIDFWYDRYLQRSQVVLIHETGRIKYLALSAAGEPESESKQARCKDNAKTRSRAMECYLV